MEDVAHFCTLRVTTYEGRHEQSICRRRGIRSSLSLFPYTTRCTGTHEYRPTISLTLYSLPTLLAGVTQSSTPLLLEKHTPCTSDYPSGRNSWSGQPDVGHRTTETKGKCRRDTVPRTTSSRCGQVGYTTALSGVLLDDKHPRGIQVMSTVERNREPVRIPG